MDFNRFKTFIFDLDGTVWCWTKLFPGVKRVIDRLNDLGKQVIFVTNNTYASREVLIKRLNNFGIKADEENVISPSTSIIDYIKRNDGRTIVFGDGLKEDLKNAGLKIVENAPAKYLVVGFVHDCKTYEERTEIAVEALEKGAEFLTSARGKIFIVGKKKIFGTGVLVENIEKASGRKVIPLGKPSKFFQELVELKVESPRKETVLFGDELHSDILLGKNAGYFTVLVKTGVDKKVVGSIRPDLVLNSVADIKI